jgi:hypothetical protein
MHGKAAYMTQSGRTLPRALRKQIHALGILMTNFDLLFWSQRVVYLLRNVIQEIEHRFSIQANHIRNVSVVFVLNLPLPAT